MSRGKDHTWSPIKLFDFWSRRSLICYSLPRIKHKIALRLNAVNAELAMLPELPARPEVEVRKNLMGFMTRLDSRLTSKSFQAKWGQKAADKFRTDIIAMKPTYNVKPASSDQQRQRQGGGGNGPVDLTGDDDETSRLSTPCPPSSSRRRSHADFAEGYPERSTPAKRQHNSSFGTPVIKGEEWDDTTSIMASTPRTHRPNELGRKQVRSLSDVRHIIAERRQPGNPDDGAHEVVEMLCMEALSVWNVPLRGLVENSFVLLRSTIHDILEESFAGMHKRQVFKQASLQMHEFLSRWRRKITGILMDIYKIETHRLFTLDTESFNRHKAAELRTLKRNRHAWRWRAHDERARQEHGPPSLKPWSEMGPDEQSKEETEHAKQALKLGADPFEVELDVCARVRGYYLTAANRFADSASLYIFSGMIPDMAEEIRYGFLDKALGITQSASRSLSYILCAPVVC